MNDPSLQDVVIGAAIIAGVSMILRLAGFWLMRHVPLTPRTRRMIDALPGSVVVAVIVPVAIKGGAVAIAAIGTAVLTMWLWRNDFVSIIAGLAAAAAVRALALG